MLYFSHRTSTCFCSPLISKIHVCEVHAGLEPKWLRQWSDGDPTPRGVVGFVFPLAMSSSAVRRCPVRDVQRAEVFGAFFYRAPVYRTSRATRGYSCAVFCTPASTPLTTPSPTPESAEATASLSQGLTCAFDVISGDCGATYSCITSPNYTENYAPEGSCVIKLGSLTLDVKDLETEVLWDTMVVNCQNYRVGSTGPVGVEADGGISYWILCP